MKKKRVGRVIAIILLIILLMFLGYLVYNYYFGASKEQKIERILKKMTKTFYEENYYDMLLDEKGSKENVVEYLGKYSKTGLRISYDSLKAYYDMNHKMNYTDLSNCDEFETKVIIYPKSPYNKTSYTLDYILSCDKK